MSELPMPLELPIPPEGTPLKDAQASASITKAKVLHKPSPVKQLQAWQRSLPPPSYERQQASLQEIPLDLSSTLPEPQSLTQDGEKPRTILYLAYGSNLAAETFLGRRGIRPLAQVNVAVPKLVMNFSLPGLPYTEPCFANTAYRDPKSSPSSYTASSETTPLLPTQKGNHHNPYWPKPLVGVVYEVTPSDFSHIIATEGGGAAYHDVLVDCHVLPAGTTTVPSVPTTPAFKAHTLFAPLAQRKDTDAANTERFGRPDPDYAQPSARYVKLITDGAEEHELPSEYMSYLQELEPYTITTGRQAIGKVVFTMTWLPIIRCIFSLGPMFHDKHGKSPKWLAWLTGAVFRWVWISYDNFLKPVFGDGERTQKRGGGDVAAGHVDSEKDGL